MTPSQVHLDEDPPDAFIWAPNDCESVIRSADPALRGAAVAPVEEGERQGGVAHQHDHATETADTPETLASTLAASGLGR